MSVFELFSEQWWLRTALAGGVVLLVGVLWMLATRQPARRQWFGEMALICSLLVAGLCALPAWLPIAIPLCTNGPSAARAAEAPAISPTASGMTAELPSVPEENLPCVVISADAMATNQTAQAIAPERLVAPAPPAVARPSAPIWFGQLEAIYFAMAGLFGMHLLVGWLGLTRLRSRSRPAPARVAALFAQLTQNWRRTPRLAVCDLVAAPVSFGVLRPTILIPPHFCRLHCAEQLQWVLVHELTHLERRDARGCLLLALSQAIYFHLPWFWWLRRQVRLAQEYVADAAAAALSSSEDYAQYLVSLSALRRRPSLAGARVTGVLGSSSELFRRVTMLLNAPCRVEKRCPRWLSWVATASLLAVAVLVSGVSVRADESATKDKKKAVDLDVDVIVNLVPDGTAQEKKDVELIVRPAQIHGVKSNVVLVQDAAPEKLVIVGDVSPSVRVGHALIQETPDPRTRRLKDLDEAVKRLQEAAKQADAQLGEDTKKQLDDLQKQLEKVRKQADEQLAKAREAQKHAAEANSTAAEALLRAAKDKHAARTYRVLVQPRSRLGAQVQSPSETLASQLDLAKDQGLVVENVLPDSAAAKAGIQNHDILVEFDGKPVSSNPMEFVKAVQAVKADSSVDAVVLRKGKKTYIKGIKLPEASKDANAEDHVLHLQLRPEKIQELQLQQIPAIKESLKELRLSDVEALKGLKELHRGDLPALKEQRFAFTAPAGSKGVTTTIILNNDRFTARQKDGSVRIEVTGSFADNKLKANKISIKDGDSESNYESLDKVPEQYRSKVKSLLESLDKGRVHAGPADKEKDEE